MKIKQLIASAVAGAMMLATAGMASALEINLYGASAQYLFWSDAAKPFLEAQGCTGVTKTVKDSKNMIVKGMKGTEECIFRVSAKASYDGILALQGNTTDPNRVNECPNPTERKMVDKNNPMGSTVCVPVTVAASDVEGESFTQASSGQLKGPLGGGLTDRSFSGIDTTGLSVCKPLVVPFAFFANTSVKKDGAPITGLSRMQAVQIFSSQVYDWSDFGTTYTAQPIVACLRHAGSGTHATIDKAVMNPAWGFGLATTEVTGGPNVYFNDGSSDLVNCVKGSGAWTGAGAIGYADADQPASGNMKRLKYNGVYPNYATIKDGEYDNFWSLQNLYYHGPDALIEALCAYAGDPAKLPVSKAPYWAATCEMNYMKEHDWLYPGYVGATCERPEALKVLPDPAL